MRGENISLRTLIIIFSLFLIFATRVETIFNLSPRILQFIFHKTGQSESGLDTKNKLKKKTVIDRVGTFSYLIFSWDYT